MNLDLLKKLFVSKWLALRTISVPLEKIPYCYFICITIWVLILQKLFHESHIVCIHGLVKFEALRFDFFAAQISNFDAR